MNAPETTTLDYVDKIIVPGNVFEEPTNEYWALMCLWQGLEFLNLQTLNTERMMRENLRANPNPFSFGDFEFEPEGFFGFGNTPVIWEGISKQLVTMAFHWYAVTACQYVRLVGAIAYKIDNNRPLPKPYAEKIIPEVVVFRDKVAAHFGWSSENSRDNDAERLMSVLPPLSYDQGRVCVGSMALHLTRGGKSSNSTAIQQWSLTVIHERLKKRYLPSKPETNVTQQDSSSETSEQASENISPEDQQL